ncbi:MAG TPA: orotidine-5'-phosphate decarboxylase [Polyangiaceae bacterium]|nr:orotidine-5'-phosphate decarboxylase [Polyangiaceae bacterium]
MATWHFADRFIEASRRLGNPLCVGLDPHLERIPHGFGVRLDDLASDATADGVERFFSAVLDSCAGKVPIVKPQVAFFEQLGWRGVRALERIVAHARDRGLLVLLDAKRGDIGTTAQAYAQSYLWPESPCHADALTLNPYLGLDSLEPFVAASRAHGAGLFVLARTSNPGAADFQGLNVDGEPLYQRVARALAPASDALRGDSGWSNLGVVAGATYPEESARLREVLPHALFLVPGYGAQGAPLQAALRGFVRGAGCLEGGMVSSSRGILFGTGPLEASARASIAEWHRGFVARLDAARDEVGAAVALAG